MLEHTVKGLVESAVVTHRRTGAKATLIVTLASAEPWSDFDVRVEHDRAFKASGEGVWRYLQIYGDWFRYTVQYIQERRHTGRPLFRIDAPIQAFGIQFFVEVPIHKPEAEREPEHV